VVEIGNNSPTMVITVRGIVMIAECIITILPVIITVDVMTDAATSQVENPLARELHPGNNVLLLLEE
jgi:hypothetical protein